MSRTAALLGVLIASCTSSEYTVVVRFEDESLASAVQRVELTLVRDCAAQSDRGGEAVDGLERIEVTRESSATLSDVVSGEYGLYARGWADGCSVVAAGCTTSVVEAGGSGTIVVFVTGVRGPGCAPADMCIGTRCVPEGTDAGPPDSGGIDAGGDVDAGPGMDAGECTPGCAGDDITCGGTTLDSCALGCMEDPDPRCGVLEPSNVLDRLPLDGGPGDVTVMDTWLFDTDSGEIQQEDAMGGTTVVRSAGNGVDRASGIAFDDLSQPGEIELGVFSMMRLTIPMGAALEGRGSRALVLLVEDVAQIDGVVAVHAELEVPGPGGHAGGMEASSGTEGRPGMGPGAGRRGTGGVADDGAGGGAFGSAGGDGGGGGAAMGGMGGGPYGDPTLSPLVAGSGGGSGGGPSGPGGGGGGALQISAGTRILVGGAGVVDAAGGGGRGRPGPGGGSGGGSGGGILLEAPEVRIDGLVGSCGGGGSAGGDGSGNGADGRALSCPAAGAPATGNGGGGGAGSGNTGMATNGETHPQDGGGGGGGAGRIRINTRTGGETYGPRVVPRDGSGSSTVGTVTVR